MNFEGLVLLEVSSDDSNGFLLVKSIEFDYYDDLSIEFIYENIETPIKFIII